MLWLSASDALLASCGVCERGGLGNDENGTQSITLTLFPQEGTSSDGRPASTRSVPSTQRQAQTCPPSLQLSSIGAR